MAMELCFHITICLILAEDTAGMHLCIEVDGVSPCQMPENRGRLCIRLTLPPDSDHVGITLVALLMMNLPAVSRKKWQGVLNHVINHFLECRRVTAKRYRREENNKIAFKVFP